MAIIVEEEKKSSNTTALFEWVIVLGVIAAAAYYILFAPPPAAVVNPPPNFAAIAPIAQISFNPSSVLNNPSFQVLKQYVAEPTPNSPVSVGKTNPFMP
jgi:hypothetical protein